MKTHFKIALIVCVTSMSSLMSLGQDVHFSHMEFSPLTLNPAMAGVHSPLQGIVNYRNQWNSVGVPYQTIGTSIDGRFNENQRGKSGIIAGGLNLFNDKAGDLGLVTTNVNLHLAYHLILDRTSTLGLGIYTGFGQQNIDPDGARWGSQYDGMAYNPGFNNGENLIYAKNSYFDAGAGLVYRYQKPGGYMTQNNQFLFTYGLALYHINRPNYSLISIESEKLFMRWSAFANADIGIPNTKGSILPGVYFQRQKTSMEILFGTYFKYILQDGSRYTMRKKPAAMYLGLFNRFRDAMVAKAMFEINQYSVGFAYDFNISSLVTVSQARGGFELFLRFNMGEGTSFGRM
jgi:type IX secretion system PorP/SprF family membrane protein